MLLLISARSTMRMPHHHSCRTPLSCRPFIPDGMTILPGSSMVNPASSECPPYSTCGVYRPVGRVGVLDRRRAERGRRCRDGQSAREQDGHGRAGPAVLVGDVEVCPPLSSLSAYSCMLTVNDRWSHGTPTSRLLWRRPALTLRLRDILPPYPQALWRPSGRQGPCYRGGKPHPRCAPGHVLARGRSLPS